MTGATDSADVVTKARLKALAWLVRHNEVTIGQMITYLFMVRREHVTPIIEAWKEHGVSTELVKALADRFAPRDKDPTTEETAP